MDAKTGLAQTLGWTAACAAAGVVAVALILSRAKESDPQENQSEERVSANRSLTPPLYVQESQSADEARGGTVLILSDSSSRSIASTAVEPRIRDESVAPEELSSVEDLTAALADPDSNVRMDAVSALGDLDDEQAALMLASVASEDIQPSVRTAALYAMAGRQIDARNPAFTRALNDVDPDVRKAAIGALERIGTEQSVPTLAIALKDRDASVRATAVDALGEIGGDAAGSLLELALKDESEIVREAAAAQLEQMPSAR